MKITIDNYFGLEVEEFRQSLRTLSREVLVECPPPAAVQLAGPAELVQISIDPETLKLIFEYAKGLVETGVVAVLLKKFGEGLSEELGKLTAGKVVETFRLLWEKLHERVRSRQAARIYVGLDFAVGPYRVEIDEGIFPTTLIGKEDVTRAFALIVLRLMPILDDFAKAAQKHEVPIKKISAMLAFESDQKWYWRVEISPLGSFRLEPNGMFKPAYSESERGVRFWTHWRWRRWGIRSKDVKTLMRAYNRKRARL